MAPLSLPIPGQFIQGLGPDSLGSRKRVVRGRDFLQSFQCQRILLHGFPNRLPKPNGLMEGVQLLAGAKRLGRAVQGIVLIIEHAQFRQDELTQVLVGVAKIQELIDLQYLGFGDLQKEDLLPYDLRGGQNVCLLISPWRLDTGTNVFNELSLVQSPGDTWKAAPEFLKAEHIQGPAQRDFRIDLNKAPIRQAIQGAL